MGKIFLNFGKSFGSIILATRSVLKLSLVKIKKSSWIFEYLFEKFHKNYEYFEKFEKIYQFFFEYSRLGEGANSPRFSTHRLIEEILGKNLLKFSKILWSLIKKSIIFQISFKKLRHLDKIPYNWPNSCMPIKNESFLYLASHNSSLTCKFSNGRHRVLAYGQEWLWNCWAG